MKNLCLAMICRFAAGFSRVQHLPVLLGAALLLAPTDAAHAAALVRASADASQGGSINTSEQTATSGSVSDMESGAEPGIEVESRASASFGELRAFAQSAATGDNTSFRDPFVVGRASFQDDFLFNAPGLTGTAGTVTVRFTIDGSLGLTANGTPSASFAFNNTFARAQYTFGVAPGSGATKSETLRGNNTRSGTPFLGIEQEFTLNFTYGTPLENVTLRIEAQAIAISERFFYTSSTISDLSNTATWGGFAAVRDASGNLVTDYTFSSTSGANYVQAIPEPGTVLLLAGAGVALLQLKRRRAR